MKRHFYLFLSVLFFGLFAVPDLKAQLEFIENQGQWPGTYGFRAKMNHGDFWLAGNKVAFVLSDFGNVSKQKHGHPHGNEYKSREHCYEMEFVGASSGVKLNGSQAKPHYHNYFISSDAKRWKARVPLYGVATHQEIYPGTDLVWKEEKGNLKYEFRLKVGIKPDKINVRYKGLNSLELKRNQLELTTSLGRITECKPFAYQEINGKKVKVECRFALRSANTVGFDFPQGYNAKYPLVIDPVLVFSTFSGSRSDNWGFSATYGENGTGYLAGICLGTKFPVTTGAFQQIYAGDSVNNIFSTFDIGVLKFSANGSQLLYATYLGGAEAEIPSSIVVDGQNNLVILGASSSSDFPTTASAFDRSYNGGLAVSPYGSGEADVRFRQGSDIIVSKLSADGTQLLGSTYLGGNQNDGVLDFTTVGNSPLVRNYGDAFRGEVAVDSLGNIFIASHTKSSNFPQAQSLQPAKSGGIDGVCAKLDPTCSSLLFSTFLGGNQDDGAFSIQLEKNGNVVLAGGTASSNFPVSAGTIHPTFQGVVDGFVCRFVPGSGMASYRGTYLGTSAYDQAYYLQVDQKRNVYLFGQTRGNYPIVGNPYRNTGGMQFIHALSPTLDTTRFSTVFGTNNGNTNISPTAFLVDDCGRIYVSGWGSTINNISGLQNGNTVGLPTTADAYRQTSEGSDFYIMVLERNADSLAFGTFFGDQNTGSEHVDGGTSRFDKKGIIYQAVCAACYSGSAFPTTPGVVSNTNGSNACNNALFKYDFSLLKSKYQPSAIQGCAPLTVKFKSLSTFATSYSWDFGDGQNVNTLTDTVTHVFDSSGTFAVKLAAINPDGCPSVDVSTQNITVQKIPKVPGDSLFFCKSNDTLTLTGLPPSYSYNWEPSQFLSSASALQPQVIHPDTTLFYTATVSSSFGCKRQVEYRVADRRLEVQAFSDSLIGCKPFAVHFSSQNKNAKSITWYWGNGDSTNTTLDTVSHLFEAVGTYHILVRAFNDTACFPFAYDTLTIRVEDAPAFNDTTLSFCTLSDQMQINWLPQQASHQYQWTPSNFLSSATVASPLFNQPDSSLTYQATLTTALGCKRTRNLVLLNRAHVAKASADTLIGCLPLTVQFGNQSYHGGNFSWIWSATDSLVSNDSLVTHVFQTEGTFPILLHSRNDTACEVHTYDTLVVQVKDAPLFNDSLLSFCQLGDSLQLQWLPDDASYQYQWSPPDFLSSTSVVSPLFIQPDSSITYQAMLTTAFGCKRTRNLQLSNRAHQAKAKADTLKGCIPFTPVFTNQTYQGGNYSWKWADGDSTATNSTLVSHLYPVEGTYAVVLRSMNDTACAVHSFDTLHVQALGIPTFADTVMRFCVDGPVSLQMANNRGITYDWQPAALLTNPTSPNPTMDSAAAQAFIVSIKDSNQCAYAGQVHLRDGRLKAGFLPTQVGICVPLQVTLINTGMNAQQVVWYKNGDSVLTGGGDNFSFTALTPGNYVLGMRVKSDTACTTEAYTEQTLLLGGVGILPTQEVKVCRGDSVSVQVPSQPGWRYSWPTIASPFGDSSRARVPSLGVVPNPFEVRIQDSLGCQGEQSVIINPFRPPVFITPVSRFDPCTDALHYELKGPALPQNTYLWTINGQSLEGDSVPYLFPARGSYPIRLVSTEGSCSDTLSQNIPIDDLALPLKADFSLAQSITDCYAPPQLKTTNLSIGATHFNWQWEGKSSEEQNPVLTFANKGLQTVVLTVSNGICVHDTARSVEVYPLLLPNLVTPDQNGLNDALVIKDLPPQTALEIQSRWGEKLYQTGNYQNNWVPPADFDVGFYSIRLPNGAGCSSWLKVGR